MLEIAPGVVQLTRAESGLLTETTATLVDPGQLVEFIVHHTTGNNLGDGDPVQWWRNIRSYHVDTLGYDDIAYSFGVARGVNDDEALVLEGRGWGRVGAHTYGHNATGIGVVLLGDGSDPSNITPGIERAFATLQAMHARTVAGRQVLVTHRDVNPTACPGDVFHERAHAGWPGAGGVAPAPAPAPSLAPPWPGRYLAFPPYTVGDDVRDWQARMSERGWTIDVDGWYGPQSRSVCVLFQREKGLDVDGVVGPITWDAAWTLPVTP